MTRTNKETRRILFVDDGDDPCEPEAVRLDGYELFIARDFAEGRRLALQHYFDLYILNQRTRGGSGIELCRQIRKFDSTTPVIFYSVDGRFRNMQEAFRAGAQAYLVKPVPLFELRRTVAQLLSYVGENAAEARRAEIAVIREELKIQRAEAADRIEKARELRMRAKEKAMRARAYYAFLTSGGGRGDFARLWPFVYSEEVRGRRDDQ
jgi:DNA-binding response OmpR family regulator